jgi:hypothetical protein
MAAGYWTDTRPNGNPIDEGTVCWVTEVEGINPIYTYGKTKDEVIEKLSVTQAHAQAALARRAAAPSAGPAATPASIAPRKRMTSDEVMQATSDLQNPAKAGNAMTRLIQDQTGVDLHQMAIAEFSRMAMEWQNEHPDFYAHPANKRILTDQAKFMAGGDLTMVTKDILTSAFNTLRQRGEIFDAPELPSNDNPNLPPNSPSFPGESLVQRTTERPRGQFATGARSNGFSASQVALPKTPKYTAEDIRTMPESKSRRLLESNDKDYAEACDLYFGVPARA